MKNDHYAAAGLEKFLYSVEEGDSLYSVQEKFDVPLHKLAYDNMLDNEVIAGLLLVINKGEGESFTLLPENVVDNAEEIAEKNGVDILYPFQRVYK